MSSLRQDQARRDLMAEVSSLIAQVPRPVGVEGVVASGSYSPANSDAMAVRGDTYAAIDPSQAIVHPKISLATMANGDQWGPIGNERCVLIPTQSGYIMLFEHSTDDSPGAPAGWRYINVVHGIRLKTSGGLTIQMDDVTGEVQLAAIGLDGTQDAVCTQRFVQAAIEGLRATVQTAINTLALGLQGGPGVGAPTVADVTVSGSSKVKAAQ